MATRKTRVLIVNSTLHIGGAEQVAALLAERVDRSRFDVSACYLKEPGLIAEQMLRRGVDLVPIPGLVPGKRDYLSFLKLRKLIVQRGIRIIHTHDIHGLIDGAACRLTTPGLRHVHTFHFGNYPHRTSRHKLIERTLWRVPSVLLAVGNAQAKSIRDLYRIPKDRLRVLWNGVEDPRHKEPAARPEGIPETNVPTIASISTLIPQKGLDVLLRAAALLRDSGDAFRLLIAGNGGLLEPLKQQAQALGLEDIVNFMGWVPQASERVLPVCDVFVQSSLWEAMSIVVLESMAAGKPMVVTSVGENPYVVLADVSGIVVPPGDAEALAAGLRRLLRDPDLRAKLGAAARARYLESFTTGHMIAAHEQLYAELAGKRATG